MRTLQILTLLVLLLLAAAGCGGSLLSPFAGTYSGNWTQASPSDSGTATVFVLPGGSLSGTLHDTGNNADYTVNGSISDTGVVNATLTPNGAAGTSLSGTLAFNGQNHLVGTLTTSNGTLNSMVFDLNIVQ